MLHFENLVPVQLHRISSVRLMGLRMELFVGQSRRRLLLLLFLMLGLFPRLVVIELFVWHGTGMKVFSKLVEVTLQIAFGKWLLGWNALALFQPHVEDPFVFWQLRSLNVPVGTKFFPFGFVFFGFFVMLLVVVVPMFVFLFVVLVTAMAAVSRGGGGRIAADFLVARVLVVMVFATLFVFLFVVLVSASFVS